LEFRDWSKDAIRILEELNPPERSSWRVLARFAFRDALLSVEPISILRQDDSQSPVFNLSFDALPQQAGPQTSGGPTAPLSDHEPLEEEALLPEEELESEGDEAVVPTRSCLFNVIAEVNFRLQAIAESGVQSGLEGHREWFAKTA